MKPDDTENSSLGVIYSLRREGDADMIKQSPLSYVQSKVTTSREKEDAGQTTPSPSVAVGQQREGSRKPRSKLSQDPFSTIPTNTTLGETDLITF